MSDSSYASAEQAALTASGIDLINTVGIMLFGGSISCVIYGVTCIQTFQYYRSERSKADPWYLRSVVLLLLLLDTVHEVLILEFGYYYLIKNYGDPFIFSRATWSIPGTIIVTGLIAFVVESFFVRRIWKFGHNRSVTATAMVLTVAHLAMVLWFSIDLFFDPDFPGGTERLKTTGSIGLLVAVIADVFISAAMVRYLHKSKTGIRGSNDMIGRIIALTVTTNALPTTVVILNLVTYQIWPNRLYNLAANVLLGKLYINAVLTSLNARTFLRTGDGRGPGEGLSFELAFATQPRGDHTGMRTVTADVAIRTTDIAIQTFDSGA